MKAKTLIGSAALGSAAATSILAAALVATPTDASAQAKKSSSERCADVVRAGKNGCAVQALGLSCQGTSDQDNKVGPWVKVPAGTCANIVAICLGNAEVPEGTFKSEKRRAKTCGKIAPQTDPSVVGGRLVDKFGESI